MQWFKDYITGPTHKWWVDNVWRPSWTRMVTFIYGIPAALLAAWQALGSWASDTTIGNYLMQLHVPEWVPSTLAGIALVHYVAHGRSANESN